MNNSTVGVQQRLQSPKRPWAQYASPILAPRNCSAILASFRDIAGFLLKTMPPYSTRILGAFPLD